MAEEERDRGWDCTAAGPLVLLPYLPQIQTGMDLREKVANSSSKPHFRSL